MQYGEFADIYDSLMYDVPYKRWTDFIKKRIPSGVKMLELACGTGNATLHLSSAYEVYATDISEQMLTIAEQKARLSGESVRFFCADMAKINMGMQFDGAVCICDGINYIPPKKLESTFKNIHKQLKSGAKFIFDISSSFKLNSMNGQVYYEDSDDVTYIWSNSLKNDALTMELAFFVTSDGINYSRFDETHVQYAHSVQLIKEKLLSSGFDVEDVLDDYTAKNAKETSQRITFCAVAK